MDKAFCLIPYDVKRWRPSEERVNVKFLFFFWLSPPTSLLSSQLSHLHAHQLKLKL